MKALTIIMALAAQEWEQSHERMDEETRRRADSIARLSEEVSLLNLINGLYLTKEQSERIIALARESGELRDATIKKHAALLKEFEEALTDLKKHLETCGHIPPEVEKRVQEKEAALNAVKHDYFDGLKKLEKKLCGVLTDAQKRVVDPFNPCIIPPKDLKDPVRVGQAAGETAEIEEHLETLRNLPDKAWKQVAEALFEMFLAFEEAILGKFTAEKRRDEIQRLLELTQKVRTMRDEDFETDKGRLALEVIRPITEFQDKTHELTDFYLKVSGGLTKTGKYLLNPRICPLLEAKLKHLCETKPADLDKIDPAESCDACGRKTDGRKPAIEHPGPEPRYDLFAEWLGVTGDAVPKLRDILVRGQIELLTTLAAERDDGRNILKEFLLKLLAQKEAEAMAILNLRIPGTKKTYMQRIGEIKADVEADMSDLIGDDAFEKYRASGIDLFKVKVGSLRK